MSAGPRREGSLQGLTPSKRGRKPAERNPLSTAKVARARSAKVARLDEGAAHRPYDPGRPADVVAGLLAIQPRTREGLLMAVQPLASQVGVAPACRALGVPRRFLLPSIRGPLPGISSPVLRPPGPCVRPNARTSSTCSPARASSTGHRPRSSRRCSMKAGICAPSARCTGSWPRFQPLVRERR